MAFEYDETLDCRGLSCPMPILKLAKGIKEIEKGQVLEVLSTDPGSKEDIPKWCKKSKNELIGIAEENGVYKFYIRRAKDV